MDQPQEQMGNAHHDHEGQSGCGDAPPLLNSTTGPIAAAAVAMLDEARRDYLKGLDQAGEEGSAVITSEGWTSVDITGKGLVAKRSSHTLPGYVILRDTEEPQAGPVMVSDRRWTLWLERIKLGKYVPDVDNVTGEIVLCIGDEMPGYTPRALRTSPVLWAVFATAVKKGIFDRLPPPPPPLAPRGNLRIAPVG